MRPRVRRGMPAGTGKSRATKAKGTREIKISADEDLKRHFCQRTAVLTCTAMFASSKA